MDMIGEQSDRMREWPRIGLHRLARRRRKGAAWLTPLHRRLLAVSGPLFLIMGLLAIVGAVVLHRRESSAASWPTTTGRVAAASVEVGVEGETAGRRHRHRRSRSRPGRGLGPTHRALAPLGTERGCRSWRMRRILWRTANGRHPPARERNRRHDSTATGSRRQRQS
jgi:hypothetical protein